ncbi:MAG: hypothetical protein WC785_05205 [Tatlockia sp.]|jgi:hypothetical protein
MKENLDHNQNGAVPITLSSTGVFLAPWNVLGPFPGPNHDDLSKQKNREQQKTWKEIADRQINANNDFSGKQSPQAKTTVKKSLAKPKPSLTFLNKDTKLNAIKKYSDSLKKFFSSQNDRYWIDLDSLINSLNRCIAEFEQITDSGNQGIERECLNLTYKLIFEDSSRKAFENYLDYTEKLMIKAENNLQDKFPIFSKHKELAKVMKSFAVSIFLLTLVGLSFFSLPATALFFGIGVIAVGIAVGINHIKKNRFTNYTLPLNMSFFAKHRLDFFKPVDENCVEIDKLDTALNAFSHHGIDNLSVNKL